MHVGKENLGNQNFNIYLCGDHLFGRLWQLSLKMGGCGEELEKTVCSRTEPVGLLQGLNQVMSPGTIFLPARKFLRVFALYMYL